MGTLPRLHRMNILPAILVVFSFVIPNQCAKGNFYLIDTEGGPDKYNEDSTQNKYGEKNTWESMYGEFRILSEECNNGCTFDEASEVCDKIGAHLPYIHNQEENEYIREILEESGTNTWLGLHSKYRKGAWQRYKGKVSAKYFNFAKRGFEFDKKCAVIDESNEGKWKKVECEQKHGVLCQKDPPETKDSQGRVKMGKSQCDNAERLIENDLYSMKRDTKCYDTKYGSDDKRVELKTGVQSENKVCEEIHEKYVPNHICINETISYPPEIFGRFPHHGPHRPNWAMFGEYKYCPIERHQHNVEHGCVIMLYHPCLDKDQVNEVKAMVAGCIKKHIITPSRLPTLEKPLVFVAWGCVLEMEYMDIGKMKEFVIDHVNTGPEGHFHKDGLYDHLLIKKAKVTEDVPMCKKNPRKYS